MIIDHPQQKYYSPAAKKYVAHKVVQCDFCKRIALRCADTHEKSAEAARSEGFRTVDDDGNRKWTCGVNTCP